MPDEKLDADSTNVEQPQFTFDAASNSVVFPDGNKLPIDEVAKGYMRQQDYTVKTQELSQMRKRLGAWDNFLEQLRKHPKAKDIESDFTKWWKQTEDKYLNGRKAEQADEEGAEDEDEPTEEQVAIAEMQLNQELRDYEDEIGRRLSKAEEELVWTLIAENPDLSVKEAHAMVSKRVQEISKLTEQQKRKAVSPSGGSNVFGTVSTKKSPHEMTHAEREELLSRIIKEGWK